MKTVRRAAQAARAGVVLVAISTIPQGFERGINVLRYNKFEPFVLHVVDPSEARPSSRATCALRLRDRRRARGHGHRQGARAAIARRTRSTSPRSSSFCTDAAGAVLPADVNVPFDELILRVFRRGGFLG